MSDDASDASSDRQRHSDLRLHVSRERDAGRRHVDDGAAASGAVVEGQKRMGTWGDDARLLPAVADARIFLLLFQPGELARKFLALRRGHGEIEQETAVHGVCDDALELAEIAEKGRDG